MYKRIFLNIAKKPIDYTSTCKYKQFNSLKNAVGKGKFGYRMGRHSLNEVFIELALLFTKKLLGSVHGIKFDYSNS